jgi:hypothetical protein
MGRTFGLIIVSIGLWLVFSLPTRDPMTDQRSGSVAFAVVESSSRTLPAHVSSTLSATAPVADVRTVANGPAKVVGPTRPSRTLDERTQAARSREIESEPEAAMQRPPEPVMIAAPRPGPQPSATSTLVVAGGGAQKPAAIAEQAIPSPRLVVRNEPLRIASNETNHRPYPTASDSIKVPVQAPIQAPRIFDVVRRDLAAPSSTSHASVTLPSAAGEQQTAATVSRTIRVPVTPAPDSDFSASASTGKANVKPAQAGANGADQTRGQGKSEANGREQSRVANRDAEKTASRQQAAAKTTPRLSESRTQVQRVRVAQAYSPPYYVGRLVVRSAPPPAYFVPSSGNIRRSQFRGDVLWDSIRRSGM